MRTYGSLVLDHEPKPRWSITAEPHVAVRLKRMFPRAVHHRAGTITLLDTPEIAADLVWVMSRWPLELSAEDRAHLEERDRVYTESRDAVTSILAGHSPPTELRPTALPPRDYQVGAAEIVLRTGRLLLADELGLGKTLSSLLVLRAPDALPALVVTLTHLPLQWLAELNRFLPWLHGHVITSGQPYDPSRTRRSRGVTPDVLITNYHKLAGWQDHLAGVVRTVIFDEAQELRRSGSHKYVAASRIADEAKYRMGLTATPIYNYGGEIHNVVNVLAPDALGDHSEFAREWCSGDGTKLVVRDPQALGTYLREEGLMLRRTRAEVSRELPAEPQRIPFLVDTDAETFDELSKGAADLARKILAGDGTSKELWQAAGEFDWKLRHATGVAKARHVADFVHLLLETGEPVVLFGWHRDVYDIWAQRLAAHEPAFFTGSESPAQKAAAADAFLSGRTNLLIMSLRAGAGLDGLQQRCRVVVFGEFDWSPGIHKQCIGRVDRDGQTAPVVAYFLASESGSDPAIAEVLDLKRQQSEPIVDPNAEALVVIHAEDRVRMLAGSFMATRASSTR